MTDELPRGWVRTTLGDVCTSVEKLDPKQLSQDVFSYIDIGSIDASLHRIQGVTHTPTSEAPTRARQPVRTGDVIFSTVRPYLENIACIPQRLDGAIASTGFCILRPTPLVDSNYLFHATLTHSVLSQILAKQRGVSYPAVRDSDVKAASIALPPLAEQRRIVEVLEVRISQLTAGMQAIQTARRKLDSLRRSALRAILQSDASQAWAMSTIGEQFDVFVGATPSRNIPEYWHGSIPWVSSGEIRFNRISQTRESIDIAAISNSETRIHPPGTVMLAMIGEGKTRGQAAILNIEAAHNQNSAAIRVSETDILPDYVFHVLESRYEESRREGAGGNQPALNKSKVREIPLAIPPKHVQRQIVDSMERFDQVEARLAMSLGDLTVRGQHLRRAILAQAFTGKLVPQEPNDEPASELLARIRAERDAVPPQRRTRRSAAPSTTRTVPQGTQGELAL